MRTGNGESILCEKTEVKNWWEGITSSEELIQRGGGIYRQQLLCKFNCRDKLSGVSATNLTIELAFESNLCAVFTRKWGNNLSSDDEQLFPGGGIILRDDDDDVWWGWIVCCKWLCGQVPFDGQEQGWPSATSEVGGEANSRASRMACGHR